jgi:gamma-glutamylcyclotransferase (GGCT)/AIG2-like uncharacterized protein YtfP
MNRHWDIFAYGTLRRGFSNHGYVRGCPCLGPAVTADAYGLYVADGIPYLVAGEARYPVVGEVYRVDAATLARLDALEEHPDVYCRSRADIVMADGRRCLAWIYFARRPCGMFAPAGDFARLSTI